jgi:hypothetical protein
LPGASTDDQAAAPGQPGFVLGNERLDQLLAEPQLAADVAAAAHSGAEEMDRVQLDLHIIRRGQGLLARFTERNG